MGSPAGHQHGVEELILRLAVQDVGQDGTGDALRSIESVENDITVDQQVSEAPVVHQF
ncbi:hypothetical protein ABZS88_40325 [Streptomyces sp. NPDC005480]|uniref:hypothetical protein n=1 Tax=Streptomyces sp. NPDC005480 TaxID=3154880 RepID=UPI0033B73164